MVELPIDPERSLITFRGQSSVHPITVTARPSGWFAGIVDGAFDAAGSLAGLIEVEVADLASGNPLIDRETRRRIDARRHPRISGRLTKTIEVQAERATVEGVIEFTADKTLVEGELHLERSGHDGLVVSGAGTFDVRWWGLEPPRLLMLRVEPEVEVFIRLVLVTAEE